MKLPRLNRADPRPLYRQVAAILSDAIADRTYETGQRIPSVRDLATHFQVTPLTISAALKQLVAQGLVHGRRGHGYYVLTNDVTTPTVASALDRKLRILLLHVSQLADTPLRQLSATLSHIADAAREVEAELPPPDERQR